jgi:hypothetical protein
MKIDNFFAELKRRNDYKVAGDPRFEKLAEKILRLDVSEKLRQKQRAPLNPETFA